MAFCRKIYHRGDLMLTQALQQHIALLNIGLHQGIARQASQLIHRGRTRGISEFVDIHQTLATMANTGTNKITAYKTGAAGNQPMSHKICAIWVGLGRKKHENRSEIIKYPATKSPILTQLVYWGCATFLGGGKFKGRAGITLLMLQTYRKYVYRAQGKSAGSV